MIYYNTITTTHSDLQDGPKNEWKEEHINGIIEPILREKQISAIITFDDYGVSGHSNHKSISRAVKQLKGKVRIFQLNSVPIYRKFNILLDLPLSVIDSHMITVVASIQDFLLGYRAMLQHKSQLVWFRRLYILFSRYMWINQLTEI